MTDPEIVEQWPADAETRAGRRRGRRTAMAVTAAAVVLIGGGVAVAANTASGPSGGTPAAAPSSSTPPGPPEPGPHIFHHRFGGMPFLGGYGAPLHGTFVVPKQGGYLTMTMQRGTATAVTKTTLTVRSADGWTKSYTVPAGALVNAARDGLSSIKKGHEVVVLATGTGARLTATRVLDVSLGRAQWRARDLPLRPNGRPNGGSNGAPTAPSGSDT